MLRCRHQSTHDEFAWENALLMGFPLLAELWPVILAHARSLKQAVNLVDPVVPGSPALGIG